MSSDIWILEKHDNEIRIEVGTSSVGICVSDPDENSTFFFDLRKSEEREALRTMIEVLQHQLEVHENG